MIRTSTLFVSIALSIGAYCAATRAHAAELDVNQTIAAWSAKTGIVVTQEAKAQVLRRIASEFTRRAPAAGFTTKETTALSDAIADGTPLTKFDDGKIGGITGQTKNNALYMGFRNEAQVDLLNNVLQEFAVMNVLRLYPNIHVIVRPSPPIDYEVFINGTRYEATTLSRYGVPAGPVAVKVTREGKAPCVWTGTVASQGEQVVNCSL